MHSLAQSIKKGHHPPPKERSSLADRPITGVVTSSTTTTTTTSGSVSYNVPTASGDLLPRTNPMGQPTSDRGTTTPTVNLSSFDSLLTNQPPTEPSFVNNDIEDSGKGGSVGSRGILKKGKVLPGPFVDEEELLEEPDQAAAASVDWDSSGKGSLASWDQPRGTTTAKINLQTIDSLVASNNDSTEPCLGDQPGLFEAMNRTDASKIITNLKGKGGTASQMSEKQRRDKSPRNDSPEGQTWRAMKYQQQQQQQQHPTHTKSKEAVSSPKRGVKASRAYPKSHLPGGIHIEQLENPNLLEPSGPSSQPGAFTIESTSSGKEEYKKNPKNSMSSKSQAFSKRQATSDVKSSLGVSATMPMEELEIPSPTASPTRQFSGPQFIPLKPNGSIQGRSYAIESHQGDAAPDIKESQTYEKRISGPDCSFHDDTIHSLFADDQKQKAQITFGHSVCKKTGSHPSDKNDPNSSKTAASSPGDEKPRRPGATQIIANASRELAPNIEMFQHDFGDERPAGALPATFVKEGAVPDRENGGAYTYRQRRELNSSQSSLPYDDDDESDPEEQPGAFAIEEGDQRQRTKGALTRLSSHESRMSQGSSKMSQLTSLTPSLTPLGEGRMSQGSSKMSQQASLTPSLTPLGADYLPPAIDAVVPPPAVDAVLIKGNDTSSSKRKWFIFIAIFLIVAICVGVAVPLIIGPSAPSTTMVPTIAIPTQAPTPAPTSDARLKAMVTKFSEISEKQLLEIVGTPQNEAVRWLANRDPARLEIDDPALEERYLATLFFYSSNLDHKDDSSILDYRSSESVCEWKVKMGKKDSSGIWCDVTGQIDLISLCKFA